MWNLIRNALIVFASVTVGVWTGEGTASASGDCFGGFCTCSVPGLTKPCDPLTGGGTGGVPICDHPTTGPGGGAPDLVWTCDMGANGEGTPANLTMVLNTTTSDIEAWGTDGNGEDFCCTLHNTWTSGSHILETRVQGTDYVDHIAFRFTDSSVPPVLWNHNSPNPYTTVHAQANGHLDDDVIDGSDSGGQLYHEWLNGNENDDTINGHGYG